MASLNKSTRIYDFSYYIEMKPNILMEKYELGHLVGQGTFAKVYQGRNLQTSENVAIKVMKKRKIHEVGMIEQIK